MTGRPVSAHDIEIKLHEMSVALDDAYEGLKLAEYEYYSTKADMEISIARAFLNATTAPNSVGGKITVADKDALVKDECADQIIAHNIAQASVNAARKNFERIKIQIDVTRSQSSLIRSSMELA